MNRKDMRYPYTWEQAIEILRRDPQHQQLVFDAYLTADVHENCRRFHEGKEFAETLALLRKFARDFRTVLDIPGGGGIATYAFAKSGYAVTAVEPDPSPSVGRAAIASALKVGELNARVVAAFGEKLPLDDATFDVVYVRQGLHHAHDLAAMLRELARVLKPKGLLLAAREHVVDNYGRSLRRFLDSQVDHQLYGGENAFTLADYRQAFAGPGLTTLLELGPYDSEINIYPNDIETLRRKILDSIPGRLLKWIVPADVVTSIGMWQLKVARRPGRLFTFLAQKPA